MILTVVLSSIVLFLTVSIESVTGIDCYNCFGPLCESQPQKNTTCPFPSNACFQGYGTLNGARTFGRTCGAQFPGQDCVETTCAAAGQYVPALKGLSNCTGSCCSSDLCNENVSIKGTTTPAVQTTTPTVISSARALSQKGKTKFLFAVLLFVSLTYGLVTSYK